uniref:Uncharacterized protein n=1 Tax=Oryza sativa subsp. japonica TaxID=39947 RepID=Q6H7M5_ORYSJ|nr:hypothetical protein [Oryza sativa Japonica Group]BAD25274.1 hypothetical protein [Oryza sativa Japonica Group]
MLHTPHAHRRRPPHTPVAVFHLARRSPFATAVRASFDQERERERSEEEETVGGGDEKMLERGEEEVAGLVG